MIRVDAARAARRALVAYLALTAIATAGCGVVRAANARGNVHARFGCPDATVEDLGGRRLRVAGCGRTALYYCALQWVQCSNVPMLLRQRASVELSCPASDVRIREVEPHVLHASGCGVGASYRCGVTRDGSARCRPQTPIHRAGFVAR